MLQLIVINEIFLVGNRMLSFIDHRLRVIKQVHKTFMGGLDVIMTHDFYQAPLVQNLWIFKSKLGGFNILGINFWHKNKKCYEFINILSRF